MCIRDSVGTALSISGISTLGTVQISSGIITATSGIVTYYGDGQYLENIPLSGVITSITISNNTLDQSQYLTYAVSAANTTGLGVTTEDLVFNPSTTRLGIATTSPRANLDVTDSILVSTGLGQTYDTLIKAYTNELGSLRDRKSVV